MKLPESKRAEAGTSTLADTALAGGSMSNQPMEMTMDSHITTRPDRATFLESSPYEADAGHLIGKDPRQTPVTELRRLRHPESPIKAIRAKCIDCSGGNMSEVRKCVAVKCALWPTRMGKSPFHASSASSKLDMAKVGLSSEGRAQS
jgi:hypothetical protein